MPSLLDLDELLLKVRAPAARAHINDAVAAFRANALRPAVVSAWAAVVCDIMAKVREIELTGDARAVQHVQAFDHIRDAHDVAASLDLEREILAMARDEFEFLTPHELLDLERLREDRHRCAHPAMNTAEDPYQPSAELVRYHIGSALTHLLTRAPVQGKAALARVQAEIASPLFPTDVAGATRVLRGGPLGRPRFALVRAFLLATIKATLRGDLAGDDGFTARALAAVSAASALHAADANTVYAADLPRVLAGLGDEDVWRVVRLGAAVPAVWERVPEAVHTKLERLVAMVDVDEWPNLFLDALRTPVLRASADARAATLSRQSLAVLFGADLAAAAGARPLLDRAVDLLVESRSWDATNGVIASVLLPAAATLTVADLERIAAATADNTEVERAFNTPGLLRAIRDAGTVPPRRFFEVILAQDLGAHFGGLLDGHEADYPPDVAGGGAPVDEGTRLRHPKYGVGEVLKVLEQGDEEILRVAFEDETVGRRRLVRATARFEVLA